MEKRDAADQIFSFLIKRLRKERPNVSITKEIMYAIWYSILGVLERKGEEAAWEYARTVKLGKI